MPDPLATLKMNGNLNTDPAKVAEKLGEHFSKVLSSENYIHFQNIRNAQVFIDLGENNKEPYVKFSLKELKDAWETTEPSALGEDTILYEMLKHLPEKSKEFLLDYW